MVFALEDEKKGGRDRTRHHSAGREALDLSKHGLHSPPRIWRLNSDALVCVVGPFELNGVAAEGAGLPRADIADFTVVVVVPALARNGIGDRFAEFVRSGGSECVEVGDAAEAASATRVRHHRIEDAVVDGVVIAAENLAGGAAALGDG